MPKLNDDPFLYPRVLISDRSMAENTTGNWRSLRPAVDAQRCTGCLICWKYCPEACVQLTDKVPQINFDYCKGCGICVVECPPQCISFNPEQAL